MIAVTNRHTFDTFPDPETAFLTQIARVAGFTPKAIVLREKDLDEKSYTQLAEKVLRIGTSEDPESIPDPARIASFLQSHLVIHKYPEAAIRLKVPRIHLSLADLLDLSTTSREMLSAFREIGTSVHSPEDARLAAECGATYLFAGNVWETTCKPGLEGKGLLYLREVAQSVSIPVYGIGGVSLERMPEVLAAGAAGGCMMSGFMTL